MKNISHFRWQMSWCAWHIGFRSSRYDEQFDFLDNYLFIGPFQFRWWSSK